MKRLLFMAAVALIAGASGGCSDNGTRSGLTEEQKYERLLNAVTVLQDHIEFDQQQARWTIDISKREARKLGVSKEDYRLVVDRIRDVNTDIKSWESDDGTPKGIL